MENTLDLSRCPEEKRVVQIVRLLRGALLEENPAAELKLNILLRTQLMRVCAKDRGEVLLVRWNKQLPELRQLLRSDLQAAFEGDPAAESREEILLAYPGLFALTAHRAAHFFYRQGVKILPRMMSEYAHSRTGIDIHPGAQIGSSFFMDHGTGIVIGETTVIGQHVKLYQGVTLGAISTRGGQRLKAVKRHPTIEDEVTIYAGATVLGGDTVIGRGSIIGANAFITSSVPEKKISPENPG